MKTIILTFLTLLSLNLFSQVSKSNKLDFGFYFVSNVPTSPMGFGYNIGKKVGFFNNFTFGTSSLGEQQSSYNNEGIYQIGNWGNISTGVTRYYIENQTFNVTIGLTYKVYETKNNFIFKPYLGVGLTNYKSTEQNYIQAEDVTSNTNVLGYYWINGESIEYQSNKTNISIGTFITKKFIQFGIGYEFQPKGIQFSLGFNI